MIFIVHSFVFSIVAGAKTLMSGAVLTTAYVCVSYFVTPEYLGTQDYVVRRERERERGGGEEGEGGRGRE